MASLSTAEMSAASAVAARTLVGDAGAERRIQRDLERVAAAISERVGASLQALLLVGGYARREGSVVERGGALGPYNDYDLVAVVRGRPARWVDTLNELGEEWTERLGVDVDVWPVSGDTLREAPATLFWLDVSLGGAEVLAGEPGVLHRLRPLTPRDVPLDECARLLVNRATGLALSSLEAEDRDQRRARHGHKAVLAVGDARLLAANRYHGTLAERLAELERLVSAPSVGRDLVQAYADAVAFRRRPDDWKPRGGDVDGWFAQLRGRIGHWHLDYEAWRVGAPITPLSFARWRGTLFPELPDVRRGGAVAAALRAAVKREAPLFPWLGHPRERLARASVALAYGGYDPRCRREAAAIMGLRSSQAEDREALHAGLLHLTELGG